MMPVRGMRKGKLCCRSACAQNRSENVLFAQYQKDPGTEKKQNAGLNTQRSAVRDFEQSTLLTLIVRNNYGGGYRTSISSVVTGLNVNRVQPSVQVVSVAGGF